MLIVGTPSAAGGTVGAMRIRPWPSAMLARTAYAWTDSFPYPGSRAIHIHVHIQSTCTRTQDQETDLDLLFLVFKSHPRGYYQAVNE